MSRFSSVTPLAHTSFVAFMPVRWNPYNKGKRIRQTLVFESREDRNHFPGETDEAQIERVRKEKISAGAKLKFFGGMKDVTTDDSIFLTGCREFGEETGIPVDSKWLQKEVESSRGFLHSDHFSDTNHTKYFIGFNANDLWEGWRDSKCVRKSFRIEKPSHDERDRCDEILGMPIWQDVDFLLDCGRIQRTHLKALQILKDWLEFQ